MERDSVLSHSVRTLPVVPTVGNCFSLLSHGWSPENGLCDFRVKVSATREDRDVFFVSRVSRYRSRVNLIEVNGKDSMTFLWHENLTLYMPPISFPVDSQSRFCDGPTSGRLIRPDARMNSIPDPAVLRSLIDCSFGYQRDHEIKNPHDPIVTAVLHDLFPKSLHVITRNRRLTGAGRRKMSSLDPKSFERLMNSLSSWLTGKRVDERFPLIRLPLEPLPLAERHS